MPPRSSGCPARTFHESILVRIEQAIAVSSVTQLAARVSTCVLSIALLSVSAVAMSQTDASSCGGSRTRGSGQFDYRTDRDKLPIVEAFHFTPEIETLIRGKTASIGADIDYTLNVFPNHHRALVAMAKLAARNKTVQPDGARLTIECYFDRAVRWFPTDTVARLLYADYLVKANRSADAQAQLARVALLADDNAFTHYNLGLLYLELKNYDKALVEAHAAQGLGLAKTELRDALKKAGKWRDPSPGIAPPGASAAAPAAAAEASSAAAAAAPGQPAAASASAGRL